MLRMQSASMARFAEAGSPSNDFVVAIRWVDTDTILFPKRNFPSQKHPSHRWTRCCLDDKSSKREKR